MTTYVQIRPLRRERMTVADFVAQSRKESAIQAVREGDTLLPKTNR